GGGAGRRGGGRGRRAGRPPPGAAPAARAAPPPPPVVVQRNSAREEQRQDQKERRVSLLRELNAVAATADTPRGIVVTLPDTSFRSADLDAQTERQLTRIASILASMSGIAVQVEGHIDMAGSGDVSNRRAAAVRQALVRGGIAPDAVTSRDFGNTRPAVANTTASGRMQNRRVEIAISGEAIGALPNWDHTYSLK